MTVLGLVRASDWFHSHRDLNIVDANLVVSLTASVRIEIVILSGQFDWNKSVFIESERQKPTENPLD